LKEENLFTLNTRYAEGRLIPKIKNNLFLFAISTNERHGSGNHSSGFSLSTSYKEWKEPFASRFQKFFLFVPYRGRSGVLPSKSEKIFLHLTATQRLRLLPTFKHFPLSIINTNERYISGNF